jgi:hypothetical protein
MADVTTITIPARYIWRAFVKLPLVSGWILRRKFKPGLCKEKLIAHLIGNAARFELLNGRPAAALCNIEVVLHNHLPFDIEINFVHLDASINSTGFMSVVLNSTLKIPAFSSAQIHLHELTLVERQIEFLKRLDQVAIRTKINLRWSVTSRITGWDQHVESGFLVWINKNEASDSLVVKS